MTLNWNPLKKASLHQKPLLSQGLASHEDDRLMEMTFVKLQELEENSRKLHKEVKRSEDCLQELHRIEEKLVSDLSSSAVCQESNELKTLCENYSTVMYQMGHATEDLTELSQRTVVEPMKKLSNEFPSIQAALKRRDQTLQEVQRNQQKLDKLLKLERTGPNIVKTEQMRKTFHLSREDFEKQNRLLLLELPQFYEKRVEYFQPSLQALIRSQVDYYGENTRLFATLMGESSPDRAASQPDKVAKQLAQIKSLSIVGC